MIFVILTLRLSKKRNLYHAIKRNLETILGFRKQVLILETKDISN